MTLEQSAPTLPSRDERKDVLQKEINRYIGRGFRVVSQTDLTAQLVRPKRFSLLWGCLWFFFFGIGLLLYFMYYLSKKDETVYLEINEQGEVVTNSLTEADRVTKPVLTGRRYIIAGRSFSLVGLIIIGCLLLFIISAMIGAIRAPIIVPVTQTARALLTQMAMTATPGP